MIKNHLSVDAFVQCADTPRPDNTLFPDVSSVSVGFENMETYFELMLELFKVNPQGGSSQNLWCIVHRVYCLLLFAL